MVFILTHYCTDFMLLNCRNLMVKREPVFLDFSKLSCIMSLRHWSVNAGRFRVLIKRKKALEASCLFKLLPLFVHMSSKLTSSEYTLVCPTCHATGFSNRSKLRGHLKVKHDVDLPSMNAGRPIEQDAVQNSLPADNCYSCPSCTLVFETIELVGAHLEDHLSSSTSTCNSKRSVKRNNKDRKSTLSNLFNGVFVAQQRKSTLVVMGPTMKIQY